MAIAAGLTVHCSACGAEIPPEARASFCPACGIPLTPVAEDTHVARRSVNRWLVALSVILLAGGLALGVATWRLVQSVNPTGDGEGPAAEAMDEFAPIAEDWIDEREHITDEADGGDPDGVLLAVDNAAAWTEVALEQVADIAVGVDGDSAPLYQQLVVIFEGRLDALGSLEATGGRGGGAARRAGGRERRGHLSDCRGDAGRG
jgi:zinc-ribbon domain